MRIAAYLVLLLLAVPLAKAAPCTIVSVLPWQAQNGDPYLYNLLPLAGNNCVAPLTWSNPGGGMPPGLAVDSTHQYIIGTPTTNGVYTFNLQVVDSLANTSTVSLTIPVVTAVTKPVPTPPTTFSTTYSLPGGTVRTVGCTGIPATDATNFQNAINAALAGDVIVVAAGCSYIGNFTWPNKVNGSNLWTYITTSAYSSLPPPGTRVGPSNAAAMAKITSANTVAPLTIQEGGNYLRLVGLEITSQSTAPGGCPTINGTTGARTNCFSYFLVNTDHAYSGAPITTNNITIDRCYLHGSPTQDVQAAFVANAFYGAIVDSYVSDIHVTGTEAQGFLAYYTNGPLQLRNNYFEAATEDVLFGGAGDDTNPYVPSNIVIQANTLVKQLSQFSCGNGGTVPPGSKLANGTPCPSGPSDPINQWIEKNLLEFKSARQVLATGNYLKYTWVAGQTGAATLFTVRTNHGGNLVVVDDIDFSNNIIANVDECINTLEYDDQCKTATDPNCTNQGETRRIRIYNNLCIMDPNLDGSHHWGFAIGQDLAEVSYQHNTVLMSDNSTCDAGPRFNLPGNYPCNALPSSLTHNLWIQDNAICRQPQGDCGVFGTSGGPPDLNQNMGNYSPLAPRFVGNVMFIPGGDATYTWPTGNDTTATPFVYVNPAVGDYQLFSPDWSAHTSDGKQAGIDYSALCTAGACSSIQQQGMLGLGLGLFK